MKIQPKNRKLGILLSGRGSNFEAIADSIDRGALQAEIAVVISNKATAPGLARAKDRGLNAVCIPSRGKVREQFDAEIVDALQTHDVGVVVLAGFMRVFTPLVTAAYPNLILNVHPALLPSFPGLDVQQQTLHHGVKFSGCTVHLVTDALDSGPIISQAVVPVLDDDSVDTLSARILIEEHRIYPKAIELMLSGRCNIQGRRVLTT